MREETYFHQARSSTVEGTARLYWDLLARLYWDLLARLYWDLLAS
jgi:hypothetical protein